MSGGYMAVSHLIEIPPPPLLWLAKAAENEATIKDVTRYNYGLTASLKRPCVVFSPKYVLPANVRQWKWVFLKGDKWSC